MKAIFQTLGKLEGALNHIRDRQSVLAKNVAHVETPGYRPSDLEAPNFASGMQHMLRTDAQHMSGRGVQQEGHLTVEDDGSPRADGNSVRLETQMAKLNENRLQYSATADLVSRRIALLRYAGSDGHQ